MAEASLANGIAQGSVCFYRAMLCIRGTRHGPVSVRLSQVRVLLKRLNVGSHKHSQCHHVRWILPLSGTAAPAQFANGTVLECGSRYTKDSRFLMPKISTKFDRGHPLRGRRMQVGWVKIGDFSQVSGYISITVKDRHMVSIKVE